MNQKIRIKLKSYDHNLVDKSAEKIVKTVKSTGAVVSGPIPLPTHKRIFTVNRSTFVNKMCIRDRGFITQHFLFSGHEIAVDHIFGVDAPSAVNRNADAHQKVENRDDVECRRCPCYL